MKTLRLLPVAILIMGIVSSANAAGPNTNVDILATPSTVPVGGGTINLEVSETNTGDIPLYFVFVDVLKGDEFISFLEFPPHDDSGNGDNKLDPGEIWSWILLEIPVTEPTWFTGIGKGLDPYQGYGEVTYPDYPDEKEDVFVDISGAENQPPEAGPGGPYIGTVGSPIIFDGSASVDFDGDIVSYQWNFGDGHTGTGIMPVHVYASEWAYTVTLTVTDNDGATGTASTTATILAFPNRPPVAFAGGPYSGIVGSPTIFDGSASVDFDGDIVSYQWNFGDEHTGTGVSPSHVYDAKGTYNVTLTVTDDDGATSTESTTAKISENQSIIQAPIRIDPNEINPKRNGPLNVDIYSKKGFDVRELDATTIELNGADWDQWAVGDGTTPDGYTYVQLKFDQIKVLGDLGDVDEEYEWTMRLKGFLLEDFGGCPITGECTVLILPTDGSNYASNPNPSNNATNVPPNNVTLSWTAGDDALFHEVYFGTDKDAVKNATKDSPEYKGTQKLDEVRLFPPNLRWGSSYYWRVDETNPDNPNSPWVGKVWSFTTDNNIIIDDFERYTDYSPDRIFEMWKDGYGYDYPPPGYPGNGTGSKVGYDTCPFAEATLCKGSQVMPFGYDNTGKDGKSMYSEIERIWSDLQDWTEQGNFDQISWEMLLHGMPASTGGINYDTNTQTYTITGSGEDIWGTSDEFYYAYKQLDGDGSITARIESVVPTNNWAKAGVMIRNTLDPESTHATVIMTPKERVSFERRVNVGDSSQRTSGKVGDAPLPHWIKLTRQGNVFSAEHSGDGFDWLPVTSSSPDDPSSINIQMNQNVYIGLVVTSGNVDETIEVVFTDVSTTGQVSPIGPFVTSEDVGILSNDPVQLYVGVEDSTGNLAIVNHPDDPNAVLIDDWTLWSVPLTEFNNQGVNLTSIKKVFIGVGNRICPVHGGTGNLFFDDIRLYRPRVYQHKP